MDAGLYLSIVLRPKLDLRFFPLITFAAAIAIFDSLRNCFGLAPDIKWANDVLIKDKKIAGILAETADSVLGTAVVLGMGVNLRRSAISGEIALTATSIETETGVVPDRNMFLQDLIRKLSDKYDELLSECGPDAIRAGWVERSSFAFEKMIVAALPNGRITGTTRGIAENGALRVETDGGRILEIQAGDVMKLRTSSEEFAAD